MDDEGLAQWESDGGVSTYNPTVYEKQRLSIPSGSSGRYVVASHSKTRRGGERGGGINLKQQPNLPYREMPLVTMDPGLVYHPVDSVTDSTAFVP